MKINLLIKSLIILCCITSISACVTKTQTTSQDTEKQNATSVVKFAFVDFYDNDNSYKLTINNKITINEIPKMEVPEVGLNTTVMKPITFGENFVSLYKNSNIIYQNNIVIPKNTKVIYVSPNHPHISFSEGSTLMLD